MEHFVSICDRNFLPQVLALFRSMERHCEPFVLWVLTVDDAAADMLESLALGDRMKVIRSTRVETPALAAARAERHTGEFCWTLTPFSPRIVFDADPSVQRVTYLDADLWFRGSPRPLFAELEQSGKTVLITDHNYAPDHDQSDRTGRFCVQFMTFARSGAEAVIDWWSARCLEWCYARFEDGKFGDQKYLDDWEERFPNEVHVLRDPELILGPWGATRFPFARSRVYHFHGLRLLAGGRVLLSRGYTIPASYARGLYQPYLRDLSWAAGKLTDAGFALPVQAKQPGPITALGIFARRFQRWIARQAPFQTGRIAPDRQG
ncbi:glycosyltransferase family protein [Sphingomonas psychrotolerans]|uniref:Glycosyl transferase n=1 Tax=Sphingomonas psychrotolerans TaxID=1327635 RepID=A0A2K8MNF2_9SPHN|nr:glycosyl transferase [Sphingomonas psychrotolerans]ATY34276.1 glycosyl transferase [Sphingomonas psychrotolerans]